MWTENRTEGRVTANVVGTYSTFEVTSELSAVRSAAEVTSKVLWEFWSITPRTLVKSLLKAEGKKWDGDRSGDWIGPSKRQAESDYACS